MIYLLIFIFILFIIFIIHKEDIKIIFIFISEIFFPSSKKERLLILLNKISKIPVYKNKIYNISDVNIDNCEEKLKSIVPITKKELCRDIENSISGYEIKTEIKTDEIFKHLKSVYSHYYVKNDNKYVVITSSGTTGEMGIFINDWDSWIRTQAILFINIFYDNIYLFIPKIKITMLFVLTIDGHFMSRKIAVPPLTMFFINVVVLSMFDPCLTDKINKLKPDILHSYPTLLDEILPDIDINPIIITTGSEHLSDTLRCKLQEKFENTKIIETYGTSECVFMASSCKYNKLHLSDKCIIELVDEHNNIITDDDISSDHILVTNLVNTFQPLVRYKLNDSLQYTHCMCSSKSKAIIVDGRVDDFMYFIDIFGKKHKHSPISIETIFIRIPERFIYQIVHYKQNCLNIFISADNFNDVKELVKNSMDDYIDNFFLNITYSIYEQTIERNKNGKIKQIISLI